MDIKPHIFDILKCIIITLFIVVSAWMIPYDAGLGATFPLLFIFVLSFATGLIFLYLKYLSLIKALKPKKVQNLLISSVLFLIIPIPLGLFLASSILQIERNYISSELFVKKYLNKHDLSSVILERRASFGQCLLIKYSLKFEVSTTEDKILLFDTQRISGEQGNYIPNLKTFLDTKFTREVNTKGPGVAYLVPKGKHRLEVSYTEPFLLLILDSRKLKTVASLSGKNDYVPILVDNMDYQWYVNQTSKTKESTCRGTSRKISSKSFANRYISINNVYVDQDTTGKLLYFTTSQPNLHFATIVPSGESYVSTTIESDMQPVKIAINKYTGQKVPIFELIKYGKVRRPFDGKLVNQVIMKKIVFPEPLKFSNLEIYFETIEPSMVDRVMQVITNIEPAFYNEVTF